MCGLDSASSMAHWWMFSRYPAQAVYVSGAIKREGGDGVEKKEEVRLTSGLFLIFALNSFGVAGVAGSLMMMIS